MRMCGVLMFRHFNHAFDVASPLHTQNWKQVAQVIICYSKLTI